MMNPSSLLTEFDDHNMKLKKELECSICFNIFEDPRQLACGHVFCRDCVHPLIEWANNATPKAIKCPLCRRETEVPLDGQLPMAIVVKNLIEHFKVGPFQMESEATENKMAPSTLAATKMGNNYPSMVLSPGALVTTSQPLSYGFNFNNNNYRISTVGCTEMPMPPAYRDREEEELCCGPECCSCCWAFILYFN